MCVYILFFRYEIIKRLTIQKRGIFVPGIMQQPAAVRYKVLLYFLFLAILYDREGVFGPGVTFALPLSNVRSVKNRKSACMHTAMFFFLVRCYTRFASTIRGVDVLLLFCVSFTGVFFGRVCMMYRTSSKRSRRADHWRRVWAGAPRINQRSVTKVGAVRRGAVRCGAHPA